MLFAEISTWLYVIDLGVNMGLCAVHQCCYLKVQHNRLHHLLSDKHNIFNRANLAGVLRSGLQGAADSIQPGMSTSCSPVSCLVKYWRSSASNSTCIQYVSVCACPARVSPHWTVGLLHCLQRLSCHAERTPAWIHIKAVPHTHPPICTAT